MELDGGAAASWLASAMRGASVREIVASLFYTVLAATVVAELVWLRVAGRVRGLREARCAAVMVAGALAVGALYAGVFALLWTAVGHLSPTFLRDFWSSHPVAAGITCFVAWDASGWLYHRIGHGTAWGWAAHRPHHTATEFNLTMAGRLSWMPWHGLLHHPLLALAGWSFETVAVCAVVSNVWQAWTHSATSVPFPEWFKRHVVTPEAHRWHHLADGRVVNLGPVFTIWDRLTGTWQPGPVPAASTYGIAAAPESVTSNPVHAELSEWRTLIARARRAVDERGDAERLHTVSTGAPPQRSA